MDLTATAEDYRHQIDSLLPPGPAWSPDGGVLAGTAEEDARIHARLAGLIEEADPRTTRELLSDWERVAGLPDACSAALGLSLTYAQRVAMLVAKLTGTGGQSIAYMTAVAAAFGYVITITEHRVFTTRSRVHDALNSIKWRYVWTVNAAAKANADAFTTRSAVNESLRSGSNHGGLECLLQASAPAHTLLLFNYL